MKRKFLFCCIISSLTSSLFHSNHSIQSALPAFLSPFGLLVPHIVIAGGIGLAAASGKNPHLLQIGLVIFAIGWLIVLGLVIVAARVNAHHHRGSDEKRLLLAVEIAMPLIGARILYAIVIAFKYQNASGGSLVAKIIFGVILEFLVMICYLSGGLITRNLARDRVKMRPQPAYHTAYSGV